MVVGGIDGNAAPAGARLLTKRSSRAVMLPPIKVALLALLGTATACAPGGTGSSAGSGASAELHVAGGQFFTGDIETIGGTVGPAVVSVFNSLTAVQPGERDKPVTGTLASTATAALIGLRGDRGYFSVVAGPPSLDAPGLPTFQAILSFSPELPAGALTLVVRGVDATGAVGAPALVPLEGIPAPPPEGPLVVRLRWDTEADLDLHVVVPGGIEVWEGNINSFQTPPPGTPPDPTAWQDGGILDFDSNAACVIDGRRQENVVWQVPPPPGTYVVRVDSPSLCGQAAARWTVEIWREGISIAASQGQALPSDTRLSKGAGSGVEALTFDVPPP